MNKMQKYFKIMKNNIAKYKTIMVSGRILQLHIYHYYVESLNIQTFNSLI